MGYLIKPAAESEIFTFETLIKAVSMQQLATAPYPLTPTQKAGFVFVPVTSFIQVNGTIGYSLFNHIWIGQTGTATINATYQNSISNGLVVNSVSSFLVNIEHKLLPPNIFGCRISSNRDFFISMDLDDTSGNGDGLVTMKGYYQPIFI